MIQPNSISLKYCISPKTQRFSVYNWHIRQRYSIYCIRCSLSNSDFNNDRVTHHLSYQFFRILSRYFVFVDFSIVCNSLNGRLKEQNNPLKWFKLQHYKIYRKFFNWKKKINKKAKKLTELFEIPLTSPSISPILSTNFLALKLIACNF